MGEKYSDRFRLRIRVPRNSRDLLHAANLRHGTDGFTSPPKEGVLKIFSRLKIPTVSAGFEPANLGTKGQHATSRPPKPRSIMSMKNSNDTNGNQTRYLPACSAVKNGLVTKGFLNKNVMFLTYVNRNLFYFCQICKSTHTFSK